MHQADPSVPVPLAVRLLLGRAAVQVLADRANVEVLHIKGNAVETSLREPGTVGTDIDILVDPGGVDALDRVLRDHGWIVYSTFTWGSPFEHAQTYTHGIWGHLDVHRWFPGIRLTPSDAFGRLVTGSRRADFGGTPATVPGTTEQAAILILNAARGGRDDDVHRLWTDAEPRRREAIEAVIDELDARVAFAAATGGLEACRGERDYQLWKVISEGGTRAAEWRARVRAAPSAAQALRLIARAPLVNVEHLASRLGRRPTRREVVAEFFARPVRGAREAWDARSSGRRP